MCNNSKLVRGLSAQIMKLQLFQTIIFFLGNIKAMCNGNFGELCFGAKNECYIVETLQ